MNEAIKEVIDLIKSSPDYAVWILCGLFAYKVVVIGSWVTVIKLLINRLYSFAITPKEVINKEEIKYSLDGMVLTHDGTYERLKALLSRTKNRLDKRNQFTKNYLDSEHVDFISEAIEEKFRLMEKK